VRCYGESNGAASIAIAGGTAPYAYAWDFGGVTTPDISGLPAGLHNVVVTDINGCVYPVGVAITQPDTILTAEVVTNASNTEQNNGSIVVIISGGTAPYAINWSNGATNDTLSGLQPGEYSYTIVDANGCIYASAHPVVVSGLVATEDINWSQHITIRPNPSNGNAIVSWRDLSIEHGYLTLVTATGKQMVAREINSGNGSWDLTDLELAPGLYVVVAEFNQQVIPFKVLIVE
jgi:hypothetical protein